MGTKKLVIGYSKTTEEEQFTWWVEEQTHRNGKFGENGAHTFKASNGITLTSCSCPEWSSGRAWSPNTLFVRGSQTEMDDLKCTISAEDLEKVVEAVREYNEHFREVRFKVAMSPVGLANTGEKVFIMKAHDRAAYRYTHVTLESEGSAARNVVVFQDGEKNIIFNKRNMEELGWKVTID